MASWSAARSEDTTYKCTLRKAIWFTVNNTVGALIIEVSFCGGQGERKAKQEQQGSVTFFNNAMPSVENTYDCFSATVQAFDVTIFCADNTHLYARQKF